MEKEYYSAKEFGEVFSISYREILESIKKGRIRAFKIGTGRRNPYRIHKSEILRVEITGIQKTNPLFNGKDYHV